jgi:hypothetical protein
MGQVSAQRPQPTHFSASIFMGGLTPFMQCSGQTERQPPQPTQRSDTKYLSFISSSAGRRGVRSLCIFYQFNLYTKKANCQYKEYAPRRTHHIRRGAFFMVKRGDVGEKVCLFFGTIIRYNIFMTIL